MSARDDTRLTRAVELAGRHLIALRSDIADLAKSRDEIRRLLAVGGRFAGYPEKIVNRILWNTRGDVIDEIVISDCTVHIEQMSDQCWWIGITRADGGYWSGNFTTISSRSRMRFTEQEREGFEWDHDGAHDEPYSPLMTPEPGNTPTVPGLASVGLSAVPDRSAGTSTTPETQKGTQ